MEKVAELGMLAVAISDRCNPFGLIKAYKAAARHGLKLLVAADFELLHDDEHTQLSLYALGDQGYRNLTVLISKAYQEGQVLGRPPIRWGVAAASDGLLALSGGRRGEVGQHLLAGRAVEAEASCREWMALFP